MTDDERWGRSSAQELLREFRETGRQGPFEEIVRRYAGMVFHVCLEVTRNRHDAEDAAQAAFLALAVHSKASRPIRAVGPWLRQVARRLALDVRKANKRRCRREEQHSLSRPENGGNGEQAGGLYGEDLRAVLLEELNALPAKYRMPLILQYFGGLSREEMARELGCNASTLGVRAFRAREMLAERLAARGIGLSEAMLAVALSGAVHAAVIDSLARCACRAATALASGGETGAAMISANVLSLARGAARAVALARCRLLAAVVVAVVSLLAAGAGVLARVRPADIRLRLPAELPRPMLVPARAPSIPLMLGSAEPAASGGGVPTQSERASPQHSWDGRPTIAGSPGMVWPSLMGGVRLSPAYWRSDDAGGAVLQRIAPAPRDTVAAAPFAQASGAAAVPVYPRSAAWADSAWGTRSAPAAHQGAQIPARAEQSAGGGGLPSDGAVNAVAMLKSDTFNPVNVPGTGDGLPGGDGTAGPAVPVVPTRHAVVWTSQGLRQGVLSSTLEAPGGDYVRVEFDPGAGAVEAMASISPVDVRSLPPLPAPDALLGAWELTGLAGATNVEAVVLYNGRLLTWAQPAADDLRMWMYNGVRDMPQDDVVAGWIMGGTVARAGDGEFYLAVTQTPEPSVLLMLGAAAVAVLARRPGRSARCRVAASARRDGKQ